MKRAIAVAFAFGGGIAAVGVLAMALSSWWTSRPISWNTSAITATFDAVGTEGTENRLVFHYIIENTTDRILHIDSEASARLASRLDGDGTLGGESWMEAISGDFPLWLPPKQRTRFAIHLRYSYLGGTPLPTGDTTEERQSKQSSLAAYVREELPHLDGFVMFHEPTHYQIEFPGGWRLP